MEKWDKKGTLISLGKGLLVAVSLTLAAMVVLAALIMLVTISDNALLVVNQLVKLVSIALGVRVAVGLGGRNGFALGAVVGLLYMVIGYGLYCLLDGALADFKLMAGEFGIGAVVGAVSGALVANMKPRKQRTLKMRKV